jgi:hypothetical protein
MRQCLHKDWFQVGSYLDGARNTTGIWRPALASAEVPVYPQLVDAGNVYASKDLAMKDGTHHARSSNQLVPAIQCMFATLGCAHHLF